MRNLHGSIHDFAILKKPTPLVRGQTGSVERYWVARRGASRSVTLPFKQCFNTLSKDISMGLGS